MKQVHTKEAPAAIGPYSQAVIVNNMLYSSGQIGLTKSGELVGESIEEQAHQVFRNLQAVLKAGGSSLDQVVKATVYVKHMNDFPALNDVYSSYFLEHKPARSTVEVSELPKGALVEIEVIALVK